VEASIEAAQRKRARIGRRPDEESAPAVASMEVWG